MDAIWGTFGLVRRINTEKFCALAFGARELEFILVVMRAEKVPFLVNDFCRILAFLHGSSVWVRSGVLLNLSDVLVPKIFRLRLRRSRAMRAEKLSFFSP